MLRCVLILTAVAFSASVAVASADYVELQRPYSYVDAVGVNSSGVVLGTGSTDLANPNETNVPFTWNGGFTTLPPSPSSAGQAVVRTTAYDINDQGRIVGQTGYTNPSSSCSSWQPRVSRGLVWSGAGVLTELGGLPPPRRRLPASGRPSRCPLR